MNITTTIPSQAGRSIRRHTAAIVAAALLGIAAVTAGAVGLSGAGDPTPAPRGATITLRPEAERPLTVYYLVTSADERDAILAAEAVAEQQRSAAGVPGLARDLHFFLVTTLEEEQAAWDMLGGVDEFVQIIDTRNPMREIRNGVAVLETGSPAAALTTSCFLDGLTDAETKSLLASFC